MERARSFRSSACVNLSSMSRSRSSYISRCAPHRVIDPKQAHLFRMDAEDAHLLGLDAQESPSVIRQALRNLASQFGNSTKLAISSGLECRFLGANAVSKNAALINASDASHQLLAL